MVIHNSNLDFQGTCPNVERDLYVPELTSNTHGGTEVAGAGELRGKGHAQNQPQPWRKPEPGEEAWPQVGKQPGQQGAGRVEAAWLRKALPDFMVPNGSSYLGEKTGELEGHFFPTPSPSSWTISLQTSPIRTTYGFQTFAISLPDSKKNSYGSRSRSVHLFAQQQVQNASLGSSFL